MERILKAEKKKKENLINLMTFKKKIFVVLNELNIGSIKCIDVKYPEILSRYQLIHLFDFLNHFLYHSE